MAEPAAPASGLHLRPAREGDWPLIRRWIRRPEVEAWWGSAASAEARIAIAIESPSSLCRIIVGDGEPVGYAQALDAALLGSGGALAPGTWDCDLFVGSQAHRGRGIGAAALTLLADEVFTTSLAVAIAMIVPVRNERVVRACEKAGLRWQSVYQDPAAGPSWVLVRERPRLR